MLDLDMNILFLFYISCVILKNDHSIHVTY